MMDKRWAKGGQKVVKRWSGRWTKGDLGDEQKLA